MEKLSGLIIDAGDDYSGEVLRSIFPTKQDVPELIKSASYVTPEKRAQLPDDLFALVLHDGDVTLRKFACVDAGNTVLNVGYFLKTAHKLPVEAQKVAAQNLCVACGWYGLNPPEELRKVALLGALGTAVNVGLMAPTAIKDTKKNLATARAAGSQVDPSVLGGSQPPVVR